MFGFIWTSAQTVKLNFTQYVFLEGENGLVQNAVPNINHLVFCCEEKVVFLGFKREILWTPCKLVKFLPETCWLPASSLLMHLAGGPAFQEL